MDITLSQFVSIDGSGHCQEWSSTCSEETAEPLRVYPACNYNTMLIFRTPVRKKITINWGMFMKAHWGSQGVCFMWLHWDSVFKEERSQYWFSYSTGETPSPLTEQRDIFPWVTKWTWDSTLSVAVGLNYVRLHFKFRVELVSLNCTPPLTHWWPLCRTIYIIGLSDH